MRTLAIRCFLGVCVASLVFCSSSAFASENVKYYVEGEVGGSFVNLDSGGYNTRGSFSNTGSDSSVTIVPGAHVGAKLFNFLRADLGFDYRGNLGFKTNSLGTLLYATNVDNASTLMLSVYFEPVHYGKWTPYVGAGAGSAWTKIRTNDGVVEAKDTDTTFAWQAEAGIQRELTEHLSLRLGYRYIDMGTSRIPLSGMGDHVSAGDYKSELIAHEVVVGLRYSF